MSSYMAMALTTKYWRPGTDYLKEIVSAIAGKVSDDDLIVISEKAISTAIGRIVDENLFKPSLSAKLIARIWMPIVWGYILGPLCGMQRILIQRLRRYPREEGSRHKQVAIQYAGLMQALMFGSEGGIDGSNLPYAYVSLPLQNADAIAERIRMQIKRKLGKNVAVMIVDTDSTFSFRGFHFTYRPKPIKGIYSSKTFLAYVLGRMFKMRRRATPIALKGCRLQVEEALRIAEFANKVRGSGAGKNVWDMVESYNVGLTDVTWEMLEKSRHKPIVIVRKKRNNIA